MRRMYRRLGMALIAAALTIACGVQSGTSSPVVRESDLPYVRVSERDPRYFELSDGKPFIPIGLNMAYPRFLYDEEAVFRNIEDRFRKLSENGGNLVSVWLSHPFYEVEDEYAGKCDSMKIRRVDRLLSTARKYGIRVKFTFDYFQTLEEEPPAEPGTAPLGKPVYNISHGGPARDMTEFFRLEPSKERYRRKLAWFAQRYQNEPTVFAWELWNEIDKVRGNGWREWSDQMLTYLQGLFPNHLVVQSLSNYDHIRKRLLFGPIWNLPQNDFAEIHRFLNLGSDLEASKGPIDMMAADSIQVVLDAKPNKPALLSETGAVEPGDSGPSHLYEQDRSGVILHDVLFAPFFMGSAGTGQIWHWHDYVEKNDVWSQFGAFSDMVHGIDPPAEHFESIMLDNERLRVYVLRGARTTLVWCRDKKADWRNDLEGPGATVVPETVVDLSSLGNDALAGTVRLLNPWTRKWSNASIEGGSLRLPPFLRSMVIRIDRTQPAS